MLVFMSLWIFTIVLVFLIPSYSSVGMIVPIGLSAVIAVLSGGVFWKCNQMFIGFQEVRDRQHKELIADLLAGQQEITSHQSKKDEIYRQQMLDLFTVVIEKLECQTKKTDQLGDSVYSLLAASRENHQSVEEKMTILAQSITDIVQSNVNVVKQVTLEIKDFSESLRNSFEKKMDAEIALLQKREESIQGHLEKITTFVEQTDGRYEAYTQSLNENYSSLFSLYSVRQKKIEDRNHEQMIAFSDLVKNMIEDQAEDLQDIVKKQIRQTQNILMEQKEIFEQATKALSNIQERTGEQIIASVEQQAENLKLMQGIHGEIMEMNEKDIELINRLMDGTSHGS